MKLIDIQIFASGKSGWKSDLLVFGENITQLFGPNGSGKTPVVQSIAFCLGYPCVFRKDIYSRCDHVILHVSSENSNLQLKRVFSREVDIEVTHDNGDTQRFFNEKEYSLFLFDWLDIKASNLVTNANKIGYAYMASILPIFYLDQDDGYRSFYSPPNNFIKDQFSEMMRMIFSLPIKNSFDVKKGKFRAKEVLDYLDKQVEVTARQIKIAKENISPISKKPDDINGEIRQLESELEFLKKSGAGHDESINILDRLINSKYRSARDFESQISELSKRNDNLGKIVHEINTEIETLNLNEEARRVFLSFDEICSSGKCQLFSSSSESYAKNLLYLKDQIKDLERNSDLDNLKIDQLHQHKKTTEEQVDKLVEERNSILEKSEISALIDAISELKNRMFELQLLKNDFDKVDILENNHFIAISKRSVALDEYNSFSSGRVINPKLVKLRADLRKIFLYWLDILDTNNVSRDITFKDDFTPILGSETISQLKGSTRTRAVLAFHAALLELVASYNINSFEYIILDTPKQHETHHCDLDQYMKSLKKLAIKYNIQIVFSTTEYHYSGDEKDKEWNPEYQGEKQKMYLSNV